MTDTATSTRSAGADARHEVQDAKSRLSRGFQEARSQAPSALRAMASDIIESKRSQVGADLHAFAGALRQAKSGPAPSRPSHLTQGDHKAASSHLTGYAANAIDMLATQLDNRSAADIARLLAKYGRTKPGLFVGGCVLAGLALGRIFAANGKDGDAHPLYDSQDPLYDKPTRTRASATGTYTPGPAAAPTATAAAQSSDPGHTSASVRSETGHAASVPADLGKGGTHARP